MNIRELKRLKVGNTIELKHRLGSGLVKKIAMTRDDGDGRNGRYPMVLFHDNVTHMDTWCTYLVIKSRPRSVE